MFFMNFMLTLGTYVLSLSSDFISIWVWMEILTLLLMGLFFLEKMSIYFGLEYFLIQSLSSTMFIYLLWSNSSQMSLNHLFLSKNFMMNIMFLMMMVLMYLLKMGLMPFFWLINLSKYFSWNSLMIYSIYPKVTGIIMIYLMIFFFKNNYNMLMMLLMVNIILPLFLKSEKIFVLLMMISSLNNVFLSSVFFYISFKSGFMFLLMYSYLSVMIIFFLKKFNMISIFSLKKFKNNFMKMFMLLFMLMLSGFPPFFLFFLKMFFYCKMILSSFFIISCFILISDYLLMVVYLKLMIFIYQNDYLFFSLKNVPLKMKNFFFVFFFHSFSIYMIYFI